MHANLSLLNPLNLANRENFSKMPDLGIVLVVDQNEIPLVLDKTHEFDDYIEYTLKLERPFKFLGNGEEFNASFRNRGYVGDEWMLAITRVDDYFEWNEIKPGGLTKNDNDIWKKQEGAELKVVYIAKDAPLGYGTTVTATVKVQKPKALDGWNDEVWTEYENSTEEVLEEYAGLMLGVEPTTKHTWKGKDPREVLEYADGEVASLTVTINVIK